MARRAKEGQSDLFPGFAEVNEIGSGDLATVYRARELATDRYVALKLLNVRDRSAQVLESFDREAGMLGPVSSHPNIVTLYGSFRAGDGRPVLVLELCRAAVSDRLIDGRGLPVRDVVSIGIKIAGALETAHRSGVLHRDVKPQNMLVTEFGEPALADFGVALLKSSTQVTAGLFDFTTLHAAPELLEGGETSPATDVYELASSLYQLIAGRSAFRANRGESPAAVILRILRDPVEPLTGADVPPELSSLLVRAMAKQRDERPATAAEFAAQLATIAAARGWPPTNCVIREAAGASGEPGAIRLADPEAPVPPVTSSVVPSDPDATWAPPPDESRQVPPGEATPGTGAPADDGWSTPSIIEHHTGERPEPVPPVPADGDNWSTPSIVTSHHPPVAPEQDVDATRRRPTTLPPPASTPTPTPTPTPTVDEPSVEVTRRRPTTLPPPPPPGAVPVSPPPPAPGYPQQEPPVELPMPDAATMNAGTLPPATPPVMPQPSMPAPPVQQPPPVQPPLEQSPPPAQSPPLPPVDPSQAQPQQPAAPELTFEDLPSNSLWVPPAGDSSGRYPVPEFPPSVEMPTATGPVPTWVFRAPTGSDDAGGSQPVGDLTLDPGSLREKVTIRSGGASLTIDDSRIVSRKWFAKTEIRWPSVRGFEARFDQAGGAGLLIAHTEHGPVELSATKGSAGDLRYVQALLDAYRRRAMSGR